MKQGHPVISVDTKKKERVGNYQNKGKQWLPKGHAEPVNGHDFASPDIPRAYPYGIYDLGRNTGFVNVGTDHDTATFAVASIRGWWRAEGRRLYADTPRLCSYGLRRRGNLETPSPSPRAVDSSSHKAELGICS